ncbi:MAG: response regulator [Chloroflexi bacterium]|nr:response regulator [Chloroflexota bacterium]
MSQQPDTILIVDDDPETRMLLSEQVLASGNFRVIEAEDGPAGLAHLRDDQPDLILMNLHLPGLSGRDVLVGLKAQGYRGPLILMAEAGSERHIVEAFRLGATDYIAKPLREPEALAAVERGLGEVRLRRQRGELTAQLQEANQQLEARIRELTTLYDIGQSVAALRELESLFERVLESVLTVTEADHALLLLQDNETGKLVLRAGKNMHLALLDRLGEPVEDDLAAMVMSSGEPMTLAGESLRRFKLSRDVHAVAYAPLAVRNTAIGVLVAGNHVKQTGFNANHGRLLKALADYAAIAIVNAQLFRMLEDRARAMENAYRELQTRDAERGRQLQDVLGRLARPLSAVQAELGRLAQGSDGPLPPAAGQKLSTLSQHLQQMVAQLAALAQRQSGPPER